METQTKHTKELDDFAIDFINKYYDELDKKRCDITETKEELIDKIRTIDWYSGWIISEVMCWGNPHMEYIKPYKVEHEGNRFIVKIGNKYYANTSYQSHGMKEVFPKYKQVLYFED